MQSTYPEKNKLIAYESSMTNKIAVTTPYCQSYYLQHLKLEKLNRCRIITKYILNKGMDEIAE